MKNINEKVCNKLDDDAQSELAGIVSQKVKEGGIIVDSKHSFEKGTSFEETPAKDHLIETANKNRVRLPLNRRMPSSRFRSDSTKSDENDPDPEEDIDIDEDFENLLKDEEIDIDDMADQISFSDKKEDKETENTKKHKESYLDDFEALLKENSDEISSECDDKNICDIEADFDALIEKENVIVEVRSTEEVKEEALNLTNANASNFVTVEDNKIQEEVDCNSSVPSQNILDDVDDGSCQKSIHADEQVLTKRLYKGAQLCLRFYYFYYIQGVLLLVSLKYIHNSSF